MASGLYAFGRESYLGGDLAWDTDDIRVLLIDATDYTVNLATDQDLVDIPAAAREEVSGSLTGKAITDGIADAADFTFTGATGDDCDALVYYLHTGTEATSILIAYVDNAAEFPITLNGGDVNVVHDTGANKIFKL